MKIIFRRKYLAFLIFMMLIFSIVNVSPAYADTCKVTTAADSGTGSLREKLADTSCYTITFDGDYNITLANSLSIDHSVMIDGYGHDVTIRGADANSDGFGDLNAPLLIIDDGDPSWITNVGIYWLTFAHGGGLSNPHGGAIFNMDSLQIYNSTFTDNVAAHLSGEANLGGGAIYNLGGLSVDHSSFTGNWAVMDLGGAIRNGIGGTATISWSSFDNNQGDMGGGAILNQSADLVLTDCTFTGNMAPGGQFGGGAILNIYGNLTVKSSSFTNNIVGSETAPVDGGAIRNAGVMVVKESTFAGNYAWNNGGAIFASPTGTSDDTNSLINNVFQDNGASVSGGAVYATANSDELVINMTNNTLRANDAPSGGNLYFEAVNQQFGGVLSASLYNNIFVKGSTGANCVFYGDNDNPPTLTADHNLADDGSCGAGFIQETAEEMKLGTLGMFNSIPLLTGSSAIDSGNNVVCPENDHRDVLRPIDGDNDGELVCDIGAFEYNHENTAPPIADLGGPYTGVVGVPILFDGSGSYDPEGGDLYFIWDFGDGTQQVLGSSTMMHTFTMPFSWIYTVKLIVQDGIYTSVAETTAEITYVTNTAPVADPGGPYLVAVNGSVALDGGGSSDPDGDSLTETWTADGGTLSGSTYTAGSETGIYDVCLIVSDGILSNEACTIVVIYDPSAGFVTGGGWIDSPAGAYAADPDLSGTATFGFVSKYKKGASVPEGNTEFQFQAGGFNFHSESYQWLVVNQDGTNAQFKGSGTVNGELDPNGEAYKFMIWATDGDPDTFRIRIWWEGEDGVEHDVYDNGVEQSISGSIVVHAR